MIIHHKSIDEIANKILCFFKKKKKQQSACGYSNYERLKIYWCMDQLQKN